MPPLGVIRAGFAMPAVAIIAGACPARPSGCKGRSHRLPRIYAEAEADKTAPDRSQRSRLRVRRRRAAQTARPRERAAETLFS